MRSSAQLLCASEPDVQIRKGSAKDRQQWYQAPGPRAAPTERCRRAHHWAGTCAEQPGRQAQPMLPEPRQQRGDARTQPVHAGAQGDAPCDCQAHQACSRDRHAGDADICVLFATFRCNTADSGKWDVSADQQLEVLVWC